MQRTGASPVVPRTLEFWFPYGSTYTYLTVMRIEPLAAAAGIRVLWKPFNLMALFRERGLPRGPFADDPVKLSYMWRDLARRAARHGLPYQQPPLYPVDTRLTVLVGIIAAREGWCPEFTKQVFRMNFVEGRSIGGPGNLEAVLDALGKDVNATLTCAETPQIEGALIAQTNQAKSLGICGAPSFVANGELFWGDDRLEDAIDWCLQH